VLFQETSSFRQDFVAGNQSDLARLNLGTRRCTSAT
jgi:hypothetical protein